MRRDPRWAPLFEGLAALGRHERFTLAGLVVGDDGGARDVYVHAKLAIVDDVWATLGSANLDAGSLGRQTELNASWWDPGLARRLCAELFAEHLGNPEATLAEFRASAHANAERLARGEPPRGLAVAIDPARYGE